MTEKMTAEQFRDIRQRAGLSTQKLAELLRFNDGAAIRKIEAGQRAVSGPVSVLMEMLDSGRL